MKEIMFNNQYGLSDAVIEGLKNETRRIEHICKFIQGWVDLGYTRIEVIKNGKVRFHNDKTGTYIEEKTRYAIDEIVAVSQSYKDAGIDPYCIIAHKDDGSPVRAIQSRGWTNKMFTRSDLMPHQIRIAGIQIEKLQEISDVSCMIEGVRLIKKIGYYYFERKDRDEGFYFKTPREAFASLIDKVSGRGTWESNPYVVVYQFVLTK